MDSRREIINRFYDGYYEDTRLMRTRHGQLEYLTTMHYINKFAPEKCRVIELGAGTGRYSAALAKAGHDVTAVELAEKNFELLKENSRGIDNLTAVQGDALDLSRFAGDSFDLTLLFGPMYHIYDEAERMTALREAVRVTKPGGVIMTAFLSVHAIMYDNYLQGNLEAGLEENFAADGRVRHFAEQVFTGYDIDEFEAQFNALPVEHITTAAADGILELAEGRADFAMSDGEFARFAEYHLQNCERRELLGCSSHLIHVCRKLSAENGAGKAEDIRFISGHSKFKYRVSAVITDRGRLLAMHDEISPYYYLPGGKVRLGETAEQAIKREVREELCVEPVIVRPLWLSQSFFSEEVDGLDYHELCFYYLVDISNTDIMSRGDRFTLFEGKHVHDFEWLAFERLKDEYLYPLFIKTEIFNLPEQLTLRTDFE